jgi:tetratricopeptide (TPR) repeat protein
MPTTTYIQRSPRHDHGWLKPDPLLTKELGIPNACSRCHGDQTIDWIIAKADAWYGPKLDSRQRARARAVSAAQERKPQATAGLLALLAQEDIPGWRATYLDLLASQAEEPAVRAATEASLHAASPLERAAAVRALASMPDSRVALRPLLADPVRLVRIDAAMALTAELPENSDARRELDAYMSLTLDQPSGLARLALDQANRGRHSEAIQTLERAEPWDASSTGIRHYIAQIQMAANRPADAAASFQQIAKKEPGNADACFRAGLAYAEAGLKSESIQALRLAVQRNPNLDRAWYNLGLLLVEQGQAPDGLEALARAEKANPREPIYPYAAATIHWQAGQRQNARAAAQRAIATDPDYLPARRLLAVPQNPKP